VDLAPVSIRAPTADMAGNLIAVPCNTPDYNPQLFNVHGITEVEGIVIDDGPICSSYPCKLRIRGKNFGADPLVELVKPDEQPDGPYSTRDSAAPAVTVDAWSTAQTEGPAYDEVRE